jgi:hypothetical protein
MEYILFAYRISATNDDLLHFTHTLEACQDAAREHRQDLRRFEETPGEEITAMPVYRCRLRVPDQQIMIDVMNNPDDEHALFRACVLEKQIVALVAD